MSGHHHCGTSTATHTSRYSYSLVLVLAQMVLVMMLLTGGVRGMLRDVVGMGGTYYMCCTLETSQLPMSWLNDEAPRNMELYITHTHTPIHAQIQIHTHIQIHTRDE